MPSFTDGIGAADRSQRNRNRTPRDGPNSCGGRHRVCDQGGDTTMAGRGVPSVTATDWLLDSDPSIRWQAMRDLTDAPADKVVAERAKVAREGVGAQLLALQSADGRWGGAAWNHGWNSTMHVLWLLRHLGLDPASEAARRTVGLVRDHVTWKGCGPQECDGNSFFA